VTIPSVTNAGTRENPIAAAEILVDGKVETPFQKILTSSGYYMRGDGNFVDFQKNGVRELSFIVNP
jgi:hypothetical protein